MYGKEEMCIALNKKRWISQFYKLLATIHINEYNSSRILSVLWRLRHRCLTTVEFAKRAPCKVKRWIEIVREKVRYWLICPSTRNTITSLI